MMIGLSLDLPSTLARESERDDVCRDKLRAAALVVGPLLDVGWELRISCSSRMRMEGLRLFVGWASVVPSTIITSSEEASTGAA